MSDRYRLIRSKHFRSFMVSGDPTPKLTKFVQGDVLVPTATELKIHAERFREVPEDTPLTIGLVPVDPLGASVATAETHGTVGCGSTATITTVSLEEKAAQILKQAEPNIREAIRQAEPAFLEVLANQEALQEKPRKRIVSMIAQRRHQLA